MGTCPWSWTPGVAGCAPRPTSCGVGVTGSPTIRSPRTREGGSGDPVPVPVDLLCGSAQVVVGDDVAGRGTPQAALLPVVSVLRDRTKARRSLLIFGVALDIRPVHPPRLKMRELSERPSRWGAVRMSSGTAPPDESCTGSSRPDAWAQCREAVRS
jgi:hypothetical protein